MLNIEPVDAKQFRQVLAVIKKIEPESQKILGRELKNKLQPFANQIASAVPSSSPLIGMEGSARTSWGPVRGRTAFTPGRGRRNATNLVAIRIEAGERNVGAVIAELAGSRSSGKTPSGAAMIQRLNKDRPMKGKGGRYAYNQFRLLRPDILATAQRIVDSFLRKFEGMI
jgi:hypothetical protein